MSRMTSTGHGSPDRPLVGEPAHHLFLGFHGSELDHGEIAAPLEGAVLVEHVGDAA
jgi:hypothetical protein